MRFSKPEKKIFFLIALCVLLAAALLLVLVLLFSGQKEEKEPASSSGPQVPGNMLRVNDIYEGQRVIPKFDFPVNDYDVKKFVEKDGIIRYEDEKSLVGVDVSEFQKDVDWQKVKDAGVEFAILRIGYRGMTEGLLNVDSCFEQNYEGARAAGIKVGVYFFSQATSEAEAVEEAQFVLQALNDRDLEYPVIFDWEQPMESESLSAAELRAYHCTGEEITSFTKAFCDEIKKSKYRPCFYINKSMAYDFMDLTPLKEYDLWYAEYQRAAPSLYYDFRMWQYTDSGNINGIEGLVDLNICFEPY